MRIDRVIVAGAFILLAQATATRLLSREEYLPSPPPLSEFSTAFGDWRMTSSSEIDPEAYAMLSPDDVLNRLYQQQGTGLNASLFMAYYRTQHKAKNAHDPKVCLPGSGWNPELNEVRQLQLPDGTWAPVNYYVIAKGNMRNVVIYWFQTHKGPAQTEQALRWQKMMDTWRENRTDMALVRFVLPVSGNTLKEVSEAGFALARNAYTDIAKQFPPKAATP